MAKKSYLDSPLYVVWFRQKEKKMCLNFFHVAKFAENFVDAYHHFKIDGYVFIEKMTVRDFEKLVEGGEV